MYNKRDIIWAAVLGICIWNLSYIPAWSIDIVVDSKLVDGEGKPRGFEYGFYLDPASTRSRLKSSDKAFKGARESYISHLKDLKYIGDNPDRFVDLSTQFQSVFADNGLADFYRAYQGGGLLGSVAGTLIRDITVPVRYCDGLNNSDTGVSGWSAKNEKPALVESYLRVFSNETLQNGYVRLRSEKTFECINVNGTALTFSVKRRWVISILRGLYHVDLPQQPIKYEISALGKQIRLMGYYEIIQPAPSNPAVTPILILPSNKEMGHYYIPSNRSCLHIRFAVKPPNGQVIGPSTPNHLEFCASGCRPGDVDGTM